jgi:hypothetical protein
MSSAVATRAEVLLSLRQSAASASRKTHPTCSFLLLLSDPCCTPHTRMRVPAYAIPTTPTTTVGGAPLPGAVVEACRGDSGVVLDSALTDDSGSYRVGNLKPGNTYLMRVKLDGRVVSAHPGAKKVCWWAWVVRWGWWVGEKGEHTRLWVRNTVCCQLQTQWVYNLHSSRRGMAGWGCWTEGNTRAAQGPASYGLLRACCCLCA